MKRKYRIMISILCLVCLTFTAAAFAACGGTEETKTISYTASTLAEGQVGKAYSASVATATGAEGITYAVEADSPALPSGLALSAAGVISGTPTEATEVEVTIVASAAGAESAKAKFTVVVKPEEIAEGDGMVFEAEYADLTDAQYSAVSYSPIVFYESAAASNGKYLGDLGKAGNTIRFKFKSSAAVQATLYVTMKSIPSVPFVCEPAVMRISVNGKDKNYKKVSLPTAFHTFEMTIDLKADDNVIEFITTDNLIMQENNIPLMPNFDCIRVKGDSTLSWTPKTDNHL